MLHEGSNPQKATPRRYQASRVLRSRDRSELNKVDKLENTHELKLVPVVKTKFVRKEQEETLLFSVLILSFLFFLFYSGSNYHLESLTIELENIFLVWKKNKKTKQNKAKL